MYSTFAAYQARGGKLTEAEYKALAQQAAEIIDAQTMGRAAEYAGQMAAELSAAECCVVDVLQRYTKAEGGLASENIEGYSYTMQTTALSDRDAEVARVLSRYLFRPEKGINLLSHGYPFGGCCPW